MASIVGAEENQHLLVNNLQCHEELQLREEENLSPRYYLPFQSFLLAALGHRLQTVNYTAENQTIFFNKGRRKPCNDLI